MRFVAVSQVCEEDGYLLRVENLIRNVNFGNGSEELSRSLAHARAVNGFRESALRRQLMQVADLKRNKLQTMLRARLLAYTPESIIVILKLKQD